MRTRSRFCPTLLTLPAALALAGCSFVASEPETAEAIAAVPTTDGAAVPVQAPVLTPTTPNEPIAISASRLNEDPLTFESIAIPDFDLIARLRRGFTLPEHDEAAVAQELAWYAGHPEYIERVFGRASRYLYHITEELEARGMPSDLALLPIVESAFDPFAYSRGRASGLWQIIPGTGEWLGLKQNWWYDGRRDVVDSTRAALDYLEILHEKFNGDWLLAVAGYNSGEGHVARAIARAEREGRPIDFWSIRDDLRAETAGYVPKLLAIRDLVADPEAHGIELPSIADEPYFDVIPTEGQIDIALVAEIGNLSVDTLYELNPGINRWATDPEGPHRLVVPIEHANQIEGALTQLASNELVRWTRHEIGRGETLSQIAETYATTPDVLRDVNGINGYLIRAGDHLMIPHATAVATSYSLSLDARTQAQQDRTRSGSRIDYRVQAGDSLWSIAQRFGVSTDALASWNAMAPGDVLSVGRDLVVWTNDPLAQAIAELSGPATIRKVNYVVRSGDSLAAIAGRFRVSLAELVEWNALNPERYLQPGQTLVLYVDVTEQST